MDDPAGLLGRIPELEALAKASPRVARAMASGDAHGVYRAVWWERRRLSAHAETVRTVLAHRRAFLMPLKGAPMMATLNGVGARVYSDGDRDPTDGTYIGTHYVTVVFVPVFPLGSYLVHSNGNQYRFFGRVPLATWSYLWRLGASAALGLGIVSAAGAAVYREAHADLRIANGLEFPVHVTVGEASVDVPAGEMVQVPTGVGTFAVTTTVDGRTLEAFVLTQGPAEDRTVYSVLGAAPVVEYDTIYTLSDSTPVDPAIHERFQCGERLHTYVAPYFFTDPPSSHDIPQGRTEDRERTVALAGGGWAACLDGAAPEVLPEWAGQLYDTLSEDASALDTITSALRRRLGVEGLLSVVTAAHAAHPDSVNLARMHQDALEDAGRTDELAAAYPEPPNGDVTSTYLYLRRLPAAESLPARRALADAHPDSDLAQNSLRWALRMTGAWDELEARSATDPDEHPYARAERLIALGRHDEAMALLQSEPADDYAARLIAEAVSRRLGRPPNRLAPAESLQLPAAIQAIMTESLSAKIGDPPLGDPARTDPAGRPDDPLAELPPDRRAATDVERALHADPTAALTALHRADPTAVLSYLDAHESALLLGEALRTGDDAVVDAIVAGGSLFPNTQAALAWLRGDAPLPEARQLETRSALELARSRMPDVKPAEKEALVQKALADELTSNLIHDAVAHWPR